MESGQRRTATASVAAAGSICERRMKINQVKAGGKPRLKTSAHRKTFNSKPQINDYAMQLCIPNSDSDSDSTTTTTTGSNFKVDDGVDSSSCSSSLSSSSSTPSGSDQSSKTTRCSHRNDHTVAGLEKTRSEVPGDSSDQSQVTSNSNPASGCSNYEAHMNSVAAAAQSCNTITMNSDHEAAGVESENPITGGQDVGLDNNTTTPPDQVEKETDNKNIQVRLSRKKNSGGSETKTRTSSVNKPTTIRFTGKQSLNLNTPMPNKCNESYNLCTNSETRIQLQSLVDLVMWRDVSKSAFVFAIGTLIIFSSSYAIELNISFISVGSYLGLVYLAIAFLYRSFICRGIVRGEDYSSRDYLLGEEEATWFVKRILPYLNEFLLKLRDLFSGDPAVTMKLAFMLFVLARCGSSITIGNIVKLGFFGAFVIPKLCSSYSTHITAYGRFWGRRFQDAWDSCSHKKALAFAIFSLVWNFSSVVARTWAGFMLYVAFRYYQRSSITDGSAGDEATLHSFEQRRAQRHRRKVDQVKEKKTFSSRRNTSTCIALNNVPTTKS